MGLPDHRTVLPKLFVGWDFDLAWFPERRIRIMFNLKSGIISYSGSSSLSTTPSEYSDDSIHSSSILTNTSLTSTNISQTSLLFQPTKSENPVLQDCLWQIHNDLEPNVKIDENSVYHVAGKVSLNPFNHSNKNNTWMNFHFAFSFHLR
jgi:hypothetical protein